MPMKKTYRRKRRKHNKRNKVPRPNRWPLRVGMDLRPDYTVEFQNPQGFFIENQAVAETKGYIVFDLANCIGHGNYCSIFDYYRINWVEVVFQPVLSTVVNRPFDDSTTPSLNQAVPHLITAIDRDDATNPVSYVAMQDRGQVKVAKATNRIYWKFTPNRLTEVYRSTTSTGYKIDRDTKSYLDCGYDDIPHYGMKFVMEAASPARAFVYEIQIKYNVSFKGKRG